MRDAPPAVVLDQQPPRRHDGFFGLCLRKKPVEWRRRSTSARWQRRPASASAKPFEQGGVTRFDPFIHALGRSIVATQQLPRGAT